MNRKRPNNLPKVLRWSEWDPKWKFYLNIHVEDESWGGEKIIRYEGPVTPATPHAGLWWRLYKAYRPQDMVRYFPDELGGRKRLKTI